MSMLVGSNPDEVDALAKQMARAADKIDLLHGDALSLIRGSAWAGPDAQHFEQNWRGEGRSRIQAAVSILRAASESAARNAADQRKASEAEGGAFVAGSSGAPSPEQTAWAKEEGAAQIAALVDQSPEAQQAWWNSLTPEQQAALIATDPTAVLALKGLPQDVRDRAQAAAVEQMKATTPMKTDETKVDGNVTVKIVKIGVNAEMTETTYADGHVEVKISGGAEIGLTAHGKSDLQGSVSVEADGSLTYSFANEAEAKAFQKGMLDSLKPEASDAWKVGMVATGGAGTYAATEVAEYLETQKDHLVSGTVGGSLNGDVTLGIPGAGKVDLHGGIGVEHDFVKKETTASIEVEGSVSGGCGPFQGAAGADGKVEVTWNDQGEIQSMSFKGSYSAETGAGVQTGVGGVSALEGTSGTYEVEINLEDPRNQQLAMDLLQGAANGDGAAVTNAYAGLADASEVTVQTNNVSTQSGGFDVTVLDVKGEHKLTTNVSTYVKPAHGNFARM